MRPIFVNRSVATLGHWAPCLLNLSGLVFSIGNISLNGWLVWFKIRELKQRGQESQREHYKSTDLNTEYNDFTWECNHLATFPPSSLSLVSVWSLMIAGSLESLNRRIAFDRQWSPDRWKVFPYNCRQSLAVFSAYWRSWAIIWKLDFGN